MKLRLPRHIKPYFFLPVIVLFMQCREVSQQTFPPRVTFDGPSYVTAFERSRIYLTIRVSSSINLSRLLLLSSINGSPVEQDSAWALSGRELTLAYTYEVDTFSSLPRTINLQFVAADEEGKTASASFVITVADKALGLGNTRNGSLGDFNTGSQSLAQWDLLENAGRKRADSASYDMINTSDSGATLMKRGWRTPQTDFRTVFARALPGIDFAQSTAVDIMNSFYHPQSKRGFTVSDLVTGDIILFRLRNGAFGMIRINSINDNDPDPAQRRIQFSYKKQE